MNEIFDEDATETGTPRRPPVFKTRIGNVEYTVINPYNVEYYDKSVDESGGVKSRTFIHPSRGGQLYASGAVRFDKQGNPQSRASAAIQALDSVDGDMRAAIFRY